MAKEKVVALTTISQGWKISLNKDVREQLGKDGTPLKIGDKLLYVTNAQGDISIRKT